VAVLRGHVPARRTPEARRRVPVLHQQHAHAPLLEGIQSVGQSRYTRPPLAGSGDDRRHQLALVTRGFLVEKRHRPVEDLRRGGLEIRRELADDALAHRHRHEILQLGEHCGFAGEHQPLGATGLLVQADLLHRLLQVAQRHVLLVPLKARCRIPSLPVALHLFPDGTRFGADHSALHGEQAQVRAVDQSHHILAELVNQVDQFDHVRQIRIVGRRWHRGRQVDRAPQLIAGAEDGHSPGSPIVLVVQEVLHSVTLGLRQIVAEITQAVAHRQKRRFLRLARQVGRHIHRKHGRATGVRHQIVKVLLFQHGCLLLLSDLWLQCRTTRSSDGAIHSMYPYHPGPPAFRPSW